ncbi:MAG: ABC transporter permease subunit [Proteobacteria bacterium]|nr:ABC transporter permease subunit [Pseudomonadota bacterium]
MGAALHQVTATGPDGRWLRGAVLATVLAGFVAPIAAGLWQTGRAAFGILPAIGASAPSLDAWQGLLAVPGLATAVRHSLVTGLGATILSLAIALGFSAIIHARMSARKSARALAPFLAVPHAAMAIGLAFLLSPSGWVARLLAPFAGWEAPPDIASVNDALGLSLTLGLVVKELPFLLLVILTALTQIPVARQMAAGRALGYGHGIVWAKVILPQVWPLIRLPVLVVLAYSLSVVDMAMILGPSNPPTLAVLLTRLFFAPDIQMLLPASAGAILQLGLVVLAFAGLLLAEAIARYTGRWWLRRGGRGLSWEPILASMTALALALAAIGALAILTLAFWSVAWRWPWPLLLPESWSAQAWISAGGGFGRALKATLVLAFATTALSLVLAIAWLEGEDRYDGKRAGWAEALIYLPLLVPQIAFLFGLNLLFLKAGFNGGIALAIWAQVLFVFPYVMITLSDPWRAMDPRLDHAAAALGAGPWRRLFRIKLPVLLAPVATAAAVGIAVSVAQYLPTLFMGAGRIATLTTEAVTLSSASDRRITAVYASLQAALPFLAYTLAIAVPAYIHRHRRDLRGGA